jgi:hypothetical protein
MCDILAPIVLVRQVSVRAHFDRSAVHDNVPYDVPPLSSVIDTIQLIDSH